MQTKPSTGSGETDAYRIEARSANGVSHVGGIPYQEKWQEISLSRGSGIPGDLWSRYTNLADCLTHDQAWALAWSFKAQAEAEGCYSIKVRVGALQGQVVVELRDGRNRVGIATQT